MFSSLYVNAGTVTKFTDGKVIIDFNGESIPSPNDKVVILDQSTHNEIGLVQIIKTKDSRALGKILKGSARPGDATDIIAGKNREEERNPADEGSVDPLISSKQKRKKVRSKSALRYGLGAHIVYTTVNIKSTNSSGALDGNGFGFNASIDYSLTPTWMLLGSLGLHPYNMNSGPQSASVSSNTTTYLASEGIVRYAFDKKTDGLWIGGGLGYFMTMSTNASTKTNEMTFLGSAGYNMKLSSSYLAIKGDFVMFQPKTLSVEVNNTTVKHSFQAYQFVLGGIYFF